MFAGLLAAFGRWWRYPISRRRRQEIAASRRLAQDLGIDHELISGVFDQVSAQLRKLSVDGDNASDVRRIIENAAEQLDKLPGMAHWREEAFSDLSLQDLPPLECRILRYSLQGKSCVAIAKLMGSNVEAVQRSLAKTRSELRLRIFDQHSGVDRKSSYKKQQQNEEREGQERSARQ